MPRASQFGRLFDPPRLACAVAARAIHRLLAFGHFDLRFPAAVIRRCDGAVNIKNIIDTVAASLYCPGMKKPTPPQIVRKSVHLHPEQWDDIAEYRFTQRIATEAEAVRQVVGAGLDALGVKRAARRAGKDKP